MFVNTEAVFWMHGPKQRQKSLHVRGKHYTQDKKKYPSKKGRLYVVSSGHGPFGLAHLPRIVCASRRTIPTTMQERTRNGNYRIAAVCVCLQSMYSVDQKPSSSFLLLQHFEYGRK
jgi:hypothetical protein